MFAHPTEIAEPRRIFSGRRTRSSHFGLRLVVVTAAMCVAGYALASALSL
jgi:hypothetical protein